MIQHIIQFNLSGRQIQEICEKGIDEDIENEISITAPHIRRFVKSMMKITEHDEDAFVDNLLHAEQTPSIANARIKNLIAFLIRVQKRLSEA